MMHSQVIFSNKTFLKIHPCFKKLTFSFERIRLFLYSAQETFFIDHCSRQSGEIFSKLVMYIRYLTCLFHLVFRTALEGA